MRWLVLAVVLLAAPARADVRTITFPLVVDYPILEAAVRRDLGMQDGGSLELWGTPGDCHWAVVDELGVGGGKGKLQLIAKGSAAVGFRLLWFCFSPLAWQGELVLGLRPAVGPDWQLRLEVLDVEARDMNGQRSPVTSGALELMRGRLEERLHDFHFDLAPPVDEAKALVRASATHERAAPVLTAIESLRPLETVADDDGIHVRLALDVPEGEAPAPGTEPALAPDEVARWEEQLDRWDAFLVFVVKELGDVSVDKGVRSELLAILLDGRRELTETLRQGPVPGTDPVRNLFLSSWDRLRVQTRRAVRDGALGDRAYRFVTFLAAADALAAIDQAGPGLGLDISADGLRRLARVLDPDRTGDPIAVSDAPDPELRALFGVEDPSESEGPPSARPARAPSSTTAPSSTLPPSTVVAPATVAPSPEPPSTEPPSTEPPSTAPPSTGPPSTDAPSTTLPLSWLFGPRSAAAATVDLAEVGHRLDRWVPRVEELASYQAVVGDLLTTVTAHREARVDPSFAAVYRTLVPTVAWQESCWRQFVERNGAVTFLLSKTGDIGMMQVNRHVWRGFFDLRKLEWDAVYNAATGAEILVQLLSRYGAKDGARPGDDAARATYAAYNGGPGAYARYRSPRANALARAIDADFYDKYRTVVAGTAGDRVLCM
jgi:hypothetical protein